MPPEWRAAQTIDGVSIQESRVCNPDNPADIAVFVKGTNNVSMQTLMDTSLASDALTMTGDMDGDGDPDRIVIKLKIMELNGHSPDFPGSVTLYDIAPGHSKTYVINARQPGTMYYHCHVQSHTHIPMGLARLFIIEENRPNNWVQTFNVGDGQVRHPPVAVLEKYSKEYDLHFRTNPPRPPIRPGVPIC